MKLLKKTFLGLCTFLLVALNFNTAKTFAANSSTENFNVVTEVTDYGQVVKELVIKTDKTINQKDLSNDLFNIHLVSTDETEVYNGAVNVTKIHAASDNIGTESESGNYIAIELEYGFGVPASHVLNFRFPEFHNHTMTLKYTITQNKDFADIKVGNVNYVQGDTVNLLVDEFKRAKSTSNLNYRYYEPKKDNKKNPLVIWIHGAGEGGTDNDVQLTGNRGAVAFASDEYQNIFGGAYVLSPQTPSFWVTDTDKTSKVELKAEKDYTPDLISLIKEYIKNNPDVDTSRVYIGGCSKGGWQTWNVILQEPDLFAAAFPICAAYTTEETEKTDFSVVKNLPIWMTHAKYDGTVSPEFSDKIYEKLKYVGANVTYTKYEDEYSLVSNGVSIPTNVKVGDTVYPDHWSWVYVANNMPTNDKGTHIINWLADQKLAASTTSSTVTSSNSTINYGALTVGGLVVLAIVIYLFKRKK